MQRPKLNKHFFFILLIFSFVVNYIAFAQKPEAPKIEDSIKNDTSHVLNIPDTKLSPIENSIRIDSSHIVVEKIPWEKIDSLRNSKAHTYTYKKWKGLNFWSRVGYWIEEILEAIFSKKGAAPYLRLLFALLIVALVVYLLVKADISGIFTRNKKAKSVNGFDYFDEDIHNQDLDKKLNQAIAEADYRKAIRFYYLILLKQLDIKGLIEWKISKTNYEYQAELLNNQMLNDFRILSGIYEYTWYGNFTVGQLHFQNWQSDFQMAIKQINQK
jgi:hypothetical protein